MSTPLNRWHGIDVESTLYPYQSTYIESHSCSHHPCLVLVMPDTKGVPLPAYLLVTYGQDLLTLDRHAACFYAPIILMPPDS